MAGDRFPNMPMTRILEALRSGKKGNFAASRNDLLSHFSGPGKPGERRWTESFGYERRPDPMKPGKPFIANGARRSSSDS